MGFEQFFLGFRWLCQRLASYSLFSKKYKWDGLAAFMWSAKFKHSDIYQPRGLMALTDLYFIYKIKFNIFKDSTELITISW